MLPGPAPLIPTAPRRLRREANDLDLPAPTKAASEYEPVFACGHYSGERKKNKCHDKLSAADSSLIWPHVTHPNAAICPWYMRSHHAAA